MSANPPAGVNLTVAIFGLIGATFSIVGFFAHYYSPRHQYGDFCNILHDINDIFSDHEWLSMLSSDRICKLYHRYSSMSNDLESLSYLVSIPSYVLVFYVGKALRLRSLRALCQIERGKKIQKFMEKVLSPNSNRSKTPQATTSNMVDDCACLPV